jgi:hypothetical protein
MWIIYFSYIRMHRCLGPCSLKMLMCLIKHMSYRKRSRSLVWFLFLYPGLLFKQTGPWQTFFIIDKEKNKTPQPITESQTFHYYSHVGPFLTPYPNKVNTSPHLAQIWHMPCCGQSGTVFTSCSVVKCQFCKLLECNSLCHFQPWVLPDHEAIFAQIKCVNLNLSGEFLLIHDAVWQL